VGSRRRRSTALTVRPSRGCSGFSGRSRCTARDEVRLRILENEDTRYGVVARSCASLWYAAALIDLKAGEGTDTTPGHIALGPSGFIVKSAPIQTYGAAIIWKAIGSIAPGLPGSYYGNWAFPPPQPAVPPSLKNRDR
jgi:hypothetical protein